MGVGEPQIHDMGRGAENCRVEVDRDLAEHDRRLEINGARAAIFGNRRSDRPRGIERDRHAVGLGGT